MKRIFIALLIFSFVLGFPALADEDLGERLSGKVLVATESNGEIWYVNPDNQERYYLGKPGDFLQAMRQLAIGVSKKDFESFNGKAPARLAGKFLLLVDEGGKIAYVNPDNLAVESFADTNSAINGVKKVALGINNANLQRLRTNKSFAERHGLTNNNLENLGNKNWGNNVGDNTDIDADTNTNIKMVSNLREIAETYINGYLMSNGEVASVVSIKPVYGLYELTVKLETQDQTVTSYISPDAKKFFPQALAVDTKLPDKKDANEDEAKDGDEGNDDSEGLAVAQVPVVELFTMSHCPYGTQMEKGLIPVLAELGDEINFELKFVDYAMHGKKELDEQMNQYCIQKEQPSKFIDYLSCFLEAGDSAGCLSGIEIDTGLLDSCVDNLDDEFKVTADYEDRETWFSGRYPRFNIDREENERYGVQGSPTLVINGEKVSARRDSASLLDVICSSFAVKPEACSAELTTVTPSPGFGSGASTSNSDLSCG